MQQPATIPIVPRPVIPTIQTAPTVTPRPISAVIPRSTLSTINIAAVRPVTKDPIIPTLTRVTHPRIPTIPIAGVPATAPVPISPRATVAIASPRAVIVPTAPRQQTIVVPQPTIVAPASPRATIIAPQPVIVAPVSPRATVAPVVPRTTAVIVAPHMPTTAVPVPRVPTAIVAPLPQPVVPTTRGRKPPLPRKTLPIAPAVSADPVSMYIPPNLEPRVGEYYREDLPPVTPLEAEHLRENYVMVTTQQNGTIQRVEPIPDNALDILRRLQYYPGDLRMLKKPHHIHKHWDVSVSGLPSRTYFVNIQRNPNIGSITQQADGTYTLMTPNSQRIEYWPLQ